MYKNETTTHLLKNIPVPLWKKVRAKCIAEGKDSVGDVILHLLTKWDKGKL